MHRLEDDFDVRTEADPLKESGSILYKRWRGVRNSRSRRIFRLKKVVKI